MSSWKYILLFFKKGFPSFTYKLLLFFLPLFGYNIFLTLYSLSNSDDGLYSFLTYSQLIPIFLCVVIIRILLKYSREANQKTFDFFRFVKKDKYGKTGLSKSFSLELKNKLEYLMNTKKVYLKHELKLDDIAELLDVSRHHASQIINENFKTNFYDYINGHRIEEAKSRLSKGFERTQSISDIAFECGFNNRVSFYKAFKKVTKVTPTQFIEKKVI